ncbi:MAG: glycosyltransferase family 39 protein [Candidatus Woesearchaeota archaeon]
MADKNAVIAGVTSRKILALVFLAALAAFLVPFSYTAYPTSDDAWQHIQKAECYLDNGGFPFKALYSLDVEDCISYPNYPPLFDVLLGLGKYLGGMMLFARIMPSLLAALVVFAFYPLARKFLDEKHALLATVLAVFAPEFMVLGSANAQPQILGILLSLLCLNFLLNIERAGSNKGWRGMRAREKRAYALNLVLAAVCSALLIYSYTTYVFFAYLIFLVSILLKRKFGMVKDIAILTLASIILGLPVLLKFLLFPPPNAGMGIERGFFLDSYWLLMPLRIGLASLVLAFFSRPEKEHRRMLYPFLLVLAFVSFFQFIAPFPPTRNLAFLVFPLAILAADGWQGFLEWLKLRDYSRLLTAVLVACVILSGIIAVYCFVQLESVTDSEYRAKLWTMEHEGKIATYNWGPFNYRAERQFNGNIFGDFPAKLNAEDIDLVVLTSKTPEIYGMSNEEAAMKLDDHCSRAFREKNVYIFNCSAPI